MLENYIHIHRKEDDDEGCSSLSDEDWKFDMEDSSFVNGDDTRVEEDDDNNLLGNDWEWYQWNVIGDDDGVPGPPMNDS